LHIIEIKVKGFRSYTGEVSIADLKAVNVFVGKNNAGKTNVLEIIRFISGLVQNSTYRNVADIVSKGMTSGLIKLNFLLSDEERKSLIQRIASGAGKEGDRFLATSFCRTIHYSVEFSSNLGIQSEFVWVSNVVKGKVMVYSMQRLNEPNQQNRIQYMATDLAQELMASNKVEDVHEKLAQVANPNVAGQYWSALTIHQANREFMVQLIRDFFSKIDWSPPNRRASYQLPVNEARKVDTNGNNIPQVWNTIVSDEPNELVEIGNGIKKIVEIASIRAPVSLNQAIASVRESSGLAFDLSNTSEGVMQTSILVTKIATNPDGTVFLIEEPELHLHAGAQRELRKFIDENSKNKQFFITTHSTIFTRTSENSTTYLVTRAGAQSEARKITEPRDLVLVKSELGHNNMDFFSYNVVLFVEGESEAVAFPIIAESLGIDLSREGVKIIDLKGKSKLAKLDEYLRYLKDSGVVPFVVLDGDSEVAARLKQWGELGVLPEGNSRVWPKEFEDLFQIQDIIAAANELGYSGITQDAIRDAGGENSIVHALSKILYETGQRELDKPALAEVLAKRVSSDKERVPKILKEFLGTLVVEAGIVKTVRK
jgi:predicted ATPase